MALILMRRIFENFKSIKLFIIINFITSTVLASINLWVLASKHSLAAKGIFEAILGVLPLIIVCNSMYNMNESHKVYQIQTEANERDKRKFQMCFDNIAESIILVSDGSVEYVNDSFLR